MYTCLYLHESCLQSKKNYWSYIHFDLNTKSEDPVDLSLHQNSALLSYTYWYESKKEWVNPNSNIFMPCPMTICQMSHNLIGRGHGHNDTTSMYFFIIYRKPKVVLKMLLFLQMKEESNNCILGCDAIYSSNYGIYLIVSWSLLKKISLSENATWLKIVSLKGVNIAGSANYCLWLQHILPWQKSAHILQILWTWYSWVSVLLLNTANCRHKQVFSSVLSSNTITPILMCSSILAGFQNV